MATLQTPQSRPPAYLARTPETKRTESFRTPMLLELLQGDAERSRKRKAFWTSVVMHLILITAIWTYPKWEKLLPARMVTVATPEELLRDRQELTYLEQPTKEQEITEKPKTDVISDKDRIAGLRAPKLHGEQAANEITNSMPKPLGANSPSLPTPAPPSHVTSFADQQFQKPTQPPMTYPQVGQVARAKPNPFAAAETVSPRSALDQAVRAAATQPGSGSITLPRGSRQQRTGVDILSDTLGVDFAPYLSRGIHAVEENWTAIKPEAAMPPMLKSGKVTIEFYIMKDGSIAGMTLVSSSGDVSLDRAAWGGITGTTFPPLPSNFPGNYLKVRYRFYYNPHNDTLE